VYAGMHHQGVFRIPGPQNEVNEFRNEFESGTCIVFNVRFVPVKQLWLWLVSRLIIVLVILVISFIFKYSQFYYC